MTRVQRHASPVRVLALALAQVLGCGGVGARGSRILRARQWGGVSFVLDRRKEDDAMFCIKVERSKPGRGFVSHF